MRGRLPIATLFRLAWRNLSRNRRRTVITASMVSFSILLLQVVMSILGGLEQQSFDNLINFQTGNAKLYAAGYFADREELPLDKPLTGLGALRDAVSQVDGVEGVTSRLTFQAQVSNGVEQLPTLGIGIELAGTDSDVFRIPDAVVAGEYLAPGQEGLLLGSGMADLFSVGPGDWLTVLTKTRAGAYEAIDLPIVGLVGTGNPLIDRGTFLLPMSLAQRLLDMDGHATELAVRFGSGAREAATLSRLASAVSAGGIEVKSWRDVEADFMALVSGKRSGSAVMLGIFMLLAMVGITNTVLMSAYERTREIGMLMAMGLRGGRIRTLFMVEGAMIGLIGAVAGTILGLGVVLALSGGIDFQAIYGDIDVGYPVRERVYPAVRFLAVAVIGVVATLLAAMASLYPAARASRQDPVDALRHA